MEPLADVLRAARVLPVLRLSSAADLEAAVGAVAAAGLGVAELTATTPGWADVLVSVRRAHPTLVVGVGTVVTDTDARLAIDGGAAFLVSPYPAPDVRRVAAAAGVPFVEGGLTPAEVAAASAYGVCKLFPAHVGGPAYLRSLLAVLPEARVVPTGGIALADVPAWLTAGAWAVGVGSDLLTDGDLATRLADAVPGTGTGTGTDDGYPRTR